MSDPVVDDLVELGWPRWVVRRQVRLLRGEVTDGVCRLLPGVETSTAPRWMFTGSQTMGMSAVSSASHIIDGGAERGQAAAAATASHLLFAVSVELTDRHDRARPHDPLSGRAPMAETPAPTTSLRECHDISRQFVHNMLSLYFQADRVNELARGWGAIVRRAVDGPDSAWGGWGLLAALTALSRYRDAFPQPGRPGWRPRSRREAAGKAGEAYWLGVAMLHATALELIGEPW
ncbi:hypothetical protein HII36_52180 [Nonomuraea sp. NN258]|uniref:hypothetical protein n=1 Tax=Nonomuraea antri TaxID=2730852 RepID=UPI001569A660|nr:hypothetical protein [Nonomuraea antri]NRQ40328.1 hypothetical protein [Nonomuraea antri]